MQPEVRRACGVLGRGLRSACAAAWAMGRRARGRRFQQPPQPEGEEDGSDGGRKRGQAVSARREGRPVGLRVEGLLLGRVSGCRNLLTCRFPVRAGKVDIPRS